MMLRVDECLNEDPGPSWLGPRKRWEKLSLFILFTKWKNGFSCRFQITLGRESILDYVPILMLFMMLFTGHWTYL